MVDTTKHIVMKELFAREPNCYSDYEEVCLTDQEEPWVGWVKKWVWEHGKNFFDKYGDENDQQRQELIDIAFFCTLHSMYWIREVKEPTEDQVQDVAEAVMSTVDTLFRNEYLVQSSLDWSGKEPPK